MLDFWWLRVDFSWWVIVLGKKAGKAKKIVQPP